MNTLPEAEMRVDLAHEPDFRLGELSICPSACKVVSAGRELRLEPRVMEVLVTLARSANHTVTRDDLIDACWGGRAVTDDAVTRVIGQVRALARSFDPPPFRLETVPRVGFRLIASGADVAAEPGATGVGGRRRARTLIAAGLALLTVAIGALGWWWFATPRGGPPLDQNGRVEVMAFESRSPDPQLRRFAADLSGKLVLLLSNAGVQTAQQPLRRDAGAGSAELRVAGSVEGEGETYVVEAQILDRKTGLVLWNDRLVRPAQEIKESPGEVAEMVAATLHCALDDRKSARTRVSTEAFALYLNACAAVFTGDPGEGRMLAVTRRLVKAAPRFADAHSMRSIAAAMTANRMEHSPGEAAALHAESEAAAREALRLDPNTAKAYSGLALNAGVLGDQFNQNWAIQEQHLRKALALDPDLPPARNQYMTLLRAVGRWNEAIEFLRATNAARDPRNPADPRVAMMLAARGDPVAGQAELDRFEAEKRISQRAMRWTIAFWWEDPKTALPKFRALAPADLPRADVDCMERFLRELDARRAARTHGLPEGCEGLAANVRLRMLGRVGDLDGAFAALGSKIPGGPLNFYYPEMKAFRSDPRFMPLANRIGLVDYWLKSGSWPDFCADPDLPYDCRAVARSLAQTR